MARYPYLAIPRHLCDTAKFPNWPISEPVLLLKQTLDAWRKEVEKKPSQMTVTQAYEDLGIDLVKYPHPDESLVRKTYYKLATMYHPDKNPNGRDIFVKINLAYEFLCSRSVFSSDGPNPNNIVLILRAQSILFDRYSEGFKHYTRETEEPEMFHTISSPTALTKMANNLAKLSILATVALAGYDMKLLLDPADQLSSAIKSQSPVNKPAATNSPQGSQKLIKSAQFQSTNPQASGYTTNATNLIQNSMHLVQSHIEKTSFKAFVDINEKNGDTPESEQSENVSCGKENTASKKKFAISGNAKNVVVKKILDNLLTQFISSKLALDGENEVLKLLTSNTRNPYLIWDNGTGRFSGVSENEEFEGTVRRHNRHPQHCQRLHIRFYNEMTTFPIQNAKSFVIDVLEYLKQGYQYLINMKANRKHIIASGQILQPTLAANHPQRLKQQRPSDFDGVLNEYNRSKARTQLERTASSDTIQYNFESNGNAVEHIVKVLKSLISVITSNGNVEIQCIGHFEMLFGFLSTKLSERIKSLALEIVSLVSRNKECVNEIAACEILGHFLVSLRDTKLKEMQDRVLETLSGLLNVQKMVKEAQSKGAVIYLLDVFVNSRNPQLREQCAELLAKMTSDKLTGPMVRISVSKFLPTVFLDAMIESPSISVQMFESTHEHPGLIWNDKTRDRVIVSITDSVSRFFLSQKENPKILWKDSDTIQDITTNELVVSGVYLKLFISNPGWTLRKPKQFLSDLQVPAFNSMVSTKDVLDTSTTALVSLLNAQPNLADAVPVLGHIPKFLRQLSVQPKSALRVLNQLSLSEICVAAIAQTSCETLSRLFKCQHDSLIRQLLECNLIAYLLNLLNSRMEFADNPSMVKAQIVSALKAMTHNLNFGDQVSHILNSNPIWAEYRDQKHDLFITDTNVRGYLTGVNPTAGYLT
ncbi:hypothetical protein HA402_008990 [Bradysia odoriphaga]|nr:hypothetical protein HA402_008990 [Bradysia odoriphaga]